MEGKQEIDLVFKVFDTINSGTQQLAGTIGQNIRWASSVDASSRILLRHMDKGGDLDATFCAQEHLEEVVMRLRNEGIPCVSGIIQGKNEELVGIISTADMDRTRLNQIIDKVREELEPGGVKPKRMIEHMSLGKARVIEDVTIPEAMLFAKFSEVAKRSIAVDEVSKHLRNIIYPSQYTKEIGDMKYHVAKALSGPGGKALEKQLMYDHENYLRVSGRMLNYNRSEGDFWIAGSAGPRIHVRENDIQQFGNDGMLKRTLSRSDPAFERQAKLLIGNIRHPVDLSTDEYEKLASLSRKERIMELRKIDAFHGRPVFSKKEEQDLTRREAERRKAAVDEIDRKTSLYEKKLALDNPEQTAYQYSYLNDEMGMPDFEVVEGMNKADSRKDKEEALRQEEEAGRRADRFTDHEEVLGSKEQEYQNCILEGRMPEGMDIREEEEEFVLDERGM